LTVHAVDAGFSIPRAVAALLQRVGGRTGAAGAVAMVAPESIAARASPVSASGTFSILF
jgi:hypothetical protein